MQLRTVRAGEGARLRALRLRALRDTPQAFATSLQLEAARPETFWADAAAASEDSNERVVFVAANGHEWIAMAGSHWFDQSAGVAQLWGMWVQPSARGRGLGSALVDEIARWARDRGAVLLRLGVTDRVAEIAAFYERRGFTRTGETKLLPPDGAVTAFFLAKSLAKDELRDASLRPH